MKSVKIFASLFVLSLLFIVGCGGNVQVTGTVKLDDGSPIPSGRVMFQKEGFVSVGEVKDGKYRMGTKTDTDGVPPGDYVVFVSGMMKPGDEIEVAAGINTQTGETSTMRMTSFTPLVAADYMSAETTPLKCKVSKAMTFDIVAPASGL